MLDSVLDTRAIRRPLAAAAARRLPSTVTAFVAGGLRAIDVVLLLLAGYVALRISVQAGGIGIRSAYGHHLLLSAMVLPFVFDKTASYQPDGLHRLDQLCGSLMLGGVILFGGLFAVGLSTDALGSTMRAWGLAWVVLSLASMTAVRALLWIALQLLAATGRLRETIAIVGDTVHRAEIHAYLDRECRQSVAILGVFGAEPSPAPFLPAGTASATLDGSLADLVALAQTRRIDKVVVVPSADPRQLDRIVHVLKSLAVDILVAPADIGSRPKIRSVDHGGWSSTLVGATAGWAEAA